MHLTRICMTHWQSFPQLCFRQTVYRNHSSNSTVYRSTGLGGNPGFRSKKNNLINQFYDKTIEVRNTPTDFYRTNNELKQDINMHVAGFFDTQELHLDSSRIIPNPNLNLRFFTLFAHQKVI